MDALDRVGPTKFAGSAGFAGHHPSAEIAHLIDVAHNLLADVKSVKEKTIVVRGSGNVDQKYLPRTRQPEFNFSVGVNEPN